MSNVWITTHSRKMEGIRSISTNPLTNTFCQFNHESKDENAICKHCYAHTYAKTRKALKEHLQENSELLSSTCLIPSVLPKYDDEYMRFNSFGEIINANHLINIFSICNNNPLTTHVLYTKRMDLVEMYRHFIPCNLIIVESNPKINEVRCAPKSNTADMVFNVVTSDYVESRKIHISCIQNCKKCGKCYNFKKGTYGAKFVVEMLK